MLEELGHPHCNVLSSLFISPGRSFTALGAIWNSIRWTYLLKSIILASRQTSTAIKGFIKGLGVTHVHTLFAPIFTIRHCPAISNVPAHSHGFSFSPDLTLVICGTAAACTRHFPRPRTFRKKHLFTNGAGTWTLPKILSLSPSGIVSVALLSAIVEATVISVVVWH